ncbi:MAG: sel1 repeat family protein [Thermoplasmata archaeon]|nr:sel1 repeat family protein [Thermoplasmata archaeon]
MATGEELIRAAESGNMDAQFQLGVQYMYGTDVPKDPARAAAWFGKAAEQGHVPAIRELGILTASGEGVEPDPVKGAQLLGRAADELDPSAMYHLGLMFEKGIGVDVDKQKAVRLLAYSAMMGYPGAEIDAQRLDDELTEERNRKLKARPVIKLMLSDVDVEAACCGPMLEDLLSQRTVFTEGEDGPALLGTDKQGFDTIYNACPYCGAPIQIVPRDKQYFG